MAADTSEKRPFEVADPFELETLGMYSRGPYSWSPDGLDLAFTRARPVRSVAIHKWEFLWGNASCDVWVALHAGDQLENITCGEEDGSGWWAPQWSPDGQRLAMVSTRHGNVHLWVGDRATRKLRQIDQHGIALFMAPHKRPFAWLAPDCCIQPFPPVSGLRAASRGTRLSVRSRDRSGSFGGALRFGTERGRRVLWCIDTLESS